jgi:RHS repeat-associated protein
MNGVVTQYTYGDAWGNLTQVVQDPGTGHLNRTTTMTYDVAGHVLTSTDPNGLMTQFQYNNLGQPTEVDFPATANTPAETVTYSYGANGRTASVTDNRGTTSISYEAGSDRVSSVTDPVTGTVSYTYDTFGDRLSMTLPGGGTWTYSFSSGSNLTLTEMLPKDDPNSLAPLLRSITDDQGRRVEFHYSLGGSLAGTTGDANSWLSGRWNQVCSNLTYSGSNLVSYQESDYTYEVDSQSGYPGSPTDTRMYLSELKNSWYSKNGQGQWQSSVLVQNDYTYDNTGQRLTNKITNPDGSSRTETYGYDETNRLTSVNYGDGQTQSYSFDALGNRASKTDVGGGINGTENYSYNNANMLLSRGTNSYTNDADGNTLTGGGRTNTWDSENRLAQSIDGANTCVYTYGSDGQRHRAAITNGGNTTTTDYVLDGTMMVRERRNSANYATYLIGPRGPEYRRDDTSGTVRWYLYDGLGSVLGEVDPNGNITSTRKLDVYGSVRSSTGTSTSKQKFVGGLGHQSDDETGLIYMCARYTDPTTGRFISEDPAKHGSDWFIYADNSPTVYVDKTGRDATIPSISVAMSGITGLLAGFASELGATIEEGEEAFRVEGEALFGDAAYAVRSLMGSLGIEGSVDQFEMWAVKTMGGAGEQFLKAWLSVNYQIEQALYYLDGDQGEIFTTHATPYVGTLRGY